FALETEFFVQMDGGPVVTENRKLDAVQVQLAEGEVQPKAHGLAAITTPAKSHFADANRQPRVAMRPQHFAQFEEADQFIVKAGADAEQEILAPALAFAHPFGDLLLGFRVGRMSIEQAKIFAVMLPAGDRSGIRRTQGG